MDERSIGIRAEVCEALRILADVIGSPSYRDHFPLNEASPVEVCYYVLDDDDTQAREEFEALRDLLTTFYDGVSYTEAEHEGNVQHVVSVPFYHGTEPPRVFYKAVWIERAA